MPCRFARFALAAVLVTAVAGCSSSAAVPPPASGPEQPDLTVAAVPAEGATGMYVAEQEGLFAKVGLHVTIKTVTSSADVITSILHGSVQVSSGQYAPYIAADAHGAAKMRIIAPGFALGPRVNEVMVGRHSAVKTVADLKGKTIAVNVVNSEVSDLLYTTLAPYGITPAQVHVTAIPFPAMPAALAAGRVAAIYETEPYVTEAAQNFGDQELADVDTGPALNFPVAGYAVLGSWAAKHPRTVAAFAKAIEEGNGIADTNIKELQRAFIAALHLNPKVADTMATGTFPTTIDPVKLQQVADLMQRYGQLTQPFSVKSMIGA
jgi:NitT/TauT family transport system substrate-binding protein